MIAAALEPAGFESEIREDFALVESVRLADFDLVTLYCTRATYRQKPDWTEKWGMEISESARRGFVDFLNGGKGILALHAATGCFDDWPEYRQILGAWWEWGYSSHPPVQEHAMHVNSDAHAIVRGLSDFRIVDELFINLRLTDSVEPLIESDWQGVTYPVSWVRKYGNGRVYYNALGHGTEAAGNPAYQELIRRGALWVAHKDVRDASPR